MARTYTLPLSERCSFCYLPSAGLRSSPLPLGQEGSRLGGKASDWLFRLLVCVRISLAGFAQEIHAVVNKMQKEFMEFLPSNFFLVLRLERCSLSSEGGIVPKMNYIFRERNGLCCVTNRVPITSLKADKSPKQPKQENLDNLM